MYKRRAVLAALAILALAMVPAPRPDAAAMAAPTIRGAIRGFTNDTVERERIDENTFLGIPSSSGAITHAQFINEHPHFAGTWGDRNLAEYMRDQLRDFGFDASLETYAERLESPERMALQLVRPARKPFDLREAPDPSDPDTQREGAIPFNYGSGDGDVRAPLVYVNRGLEADYDVLKRANVDVRGALAVIRYGAEFRGLLAERAQRHGVAGVIFYSDPKDDGAGRGPAYPNGPWRPSGSVQRGMVSETSLRIPTMPVTSFVAQQLLATIAGAAPPPFWQGALPIAYALGRGPGVAHMTVKLRRARGQIWNTIGVMAGSGPSTVILGGHRDAWVYGVSDNGSGISTLLEVARGLGYLKRSGWVPKRSIVIAGWDGEEIGEYGSRDYVRAHWQQLRRGAVAYLNADENVTGPNFDAQATGVLDATIIAATHDVADPVRNALSIYDRWLADQRAVAGTRTLVGPIVDPPGGGSDHEPFLADVGTPVSNFGFFGPLGVYHSLYDDLNYAKKYADPAFALHRTAAQILGIVAMRLANADTLPYEFSPYASQMTVGLSALTSQPGSMVAPADAQRMITSIQAFTRAAAALDDAIGRNQGPSEDRLLQAAQTLNRVVYGTVGYRSVTFPAVAAAMEKNDQKAVAAAMQLATASIDSVTAMISH